MSEINRQELLTEWSFLNYIIKQIVETFIKKWYINYNSVIEESIKKILSLENDNQISYIDNTIVGLLRNIFYNFEEYSNIEKYINLFEEKYLYILEQDENKNNNIISLIKIYSFLKNLISNNISKNWLILLDTLDKYNDENYIVGWYIRDTTLWLKAKDVDIVSTMSIKTIEKIFRTELPSITNNFNIKEVGQHFWVLLVNINGEDFEIANPRIDQYNSWIDWKGASDVQITTSIMEDSKRRDFTINQLYYNHKYNFLLDFNNGLDDLIKKEINFIWKEEDRINEDVLRILRVYKFMKKWFNPSKKTIRAIRSNFYLLCKYWNAERIRETLEKIIFN